MEVPRSFRELLSSEPSNRIEETIEVLRHHEEVRGCHREFLITVTIYKKPIDFRNGVSKVLGALGASFLRVAH